jgi:8-oxo-dGTP pyrophosphatase MutT (NUDIX family)
VLLVQRNPEARFMPGVWVFPGGAVDEGERAPAVSGDAGSPNDEERAHRAAAIRELEEEAGIALPADADLRPWSRWITPEVVPVRFDTHFFVALAPAHSPPEPDGAEVDDAGWFNPRRALETHAAGELKLVFPTIRTLETLVPYSSADEVLAAAPDRDLKPILPRVSGTREDHRVLLPGDPGYDDAAPDVNRLPS